LPFPDGFAALIACRSKNRTTQKFLPEDLKRLGL
jgi:hypothetical protein